MKRRHSLASALALGASIAGLGACTAILGDFTTSATNVTDSGPGADVLTETSVVGEGGIGFTISAPNAVFVQPGKTASVAITVAGNATNGPITIATTGLPAGVTAASLSIPQGSTSGSLVLTAAASATIGTQAAASLAASATNASAPALTLNVTVSGASGTVDTSFPKTIPYSSGLGVIQYGALQSDGKILLFGTFHTTPGDAPKLVVRLNTDGSIDSTFQSLIFTNASASPIATSLKGIVQPDGKILVAWTEGASSYLNITRLLTTGALDGTWHDPTKATVSTTDQTFVATTPSLVPLMLAADGSVTYAQYVSSSTVNVWRWTSAGIADTTIGVLGDYGHAEFDKSSSIASISAIGGAFAEADGGALFVGEGAAPSSTPADQLLFARTTPSLQVDTAFGPTGGGGWSYGLRFYTPLYESTMIGSDLFTANEHQEACTSDVTLCAAKVTIASDATNSEVACPAIASGLGCGDYAARIAVGPNKTIILGGFSGSAGGIPVVARFTTGPLAVDTTFGAGGVAKLRAASATASVELPVAVLVSTEGLVYALNQDTVYPIQRIWP